MHGRRLILKAFGILVFGLAALALAEPVEGCNPETGDCQGFVFCAWVGPGGCDEGWIDFHCSHECQGSSWGVCGEDPQCEEFGENWKAFQCF